MREKMSSKYGGTGFDNCFGMFQLSVIYNPTWQAKVIIDTINRIFVIICNFFVVPSPPSKAKLLHQLLNFFKFFLKSFCFCIWKEHYVTPLKCMTRST